MSLSRPPKQMPYDPDIVYHRGSRTLERTVRAVCGAAFGVLPGLWLAAELAPIEGDAVAWIVGLSVLACACLAARYGDRFWHAAARAIREIF
jgi:hypothetical protein